MIRTLVLGTVGERRGRNPFGGFWVGCGGAEECQSGRMGRPAKALAAGTWLARSNRASSATSLQGAA